MTKIFTGYHCFLFSQNIGYLNPKIIYFYFHYLKESFLDESVQKILYLILKRKHCWLHRYTSLHQRTGFGVDTVRLLAECDAAPLRVSEHSLFQVIMVRTVF